MIIKTTIVMDISHLYDKQRLLDIFINDVKAEKMSNLTSEDIFEKKIVALLTEIGEFINEHRGFKYWSDKPKPRTKIVTDDNCEDCNGTGIVLAPEGNINCHCLDEVFLMYEEFADTLHFMLSLGNSIGHYIPYIEFTPVNQSLEYLVIDWFRSVTMFTCDSSIENFKKMLICFGLVANKIGLTNEDICDLYDKKYLINIKRQKEGY